MKTYKKIDTNDKWTSKEHIAHIKKDTSTTQSILAVTRKISGFFSITGPILIPLLVLAVAIGEIDRNIPTYALAFWPAVYMASHLSQQGKHKAWLLPIGFMILYPLLSDALGVPGNSNNLQSTQLTIGMLLIDYLFFLRLFDYRALSISAKALRKLAPTWLVLFEISALYSDYKIDIGRITEHRYLLDLTFDSSSTLWYAASVLIAIYATIALKKWSEAIVGMIAVFTSMFFGFLVGPAYLYWTFLKITKAQEQEKREASS